MAIGLNIVAGFAGLLDLGYVAFYAFGAYTAAFLASPHFGSLSVVLFSAIPGFPGIHFPFVDPRPARNARGRDVRGVAGRADVAPSRRLPRDRHARIRRDRAGGVQEPERRELQLRPDPPREREPDRRQPRHQPDRPADLLRDPVRVQRELRRLPRDDPARGTRSSSPAISSTRGWAGRGWRSARTRSPRR